MFKRMLLIAAAVCLCSGTLSATDPAAGVSETRKDLEPTEVAALDVAREPSRDRPDGSRVDDAQKHRVRHEASHASIAVEERVHPEQPVVSGGGRDDTVDLAEAAVYLGEPGKEARIGLCSKKFSIRSVNSVRESASSSCS